MATPESDDGPVTFINVFEIDPVQVDELIVGWKHWGEIMRRQPGFRSFHLHRALSADALACP